MKKSSFDSEQDLLYAVLKEVYYSQHAHPDAKPLGRYVANPLQDKAFFKRVSSPKSYIKLEAADIRPFIPVFKIMSEAAVTLIIEICQLLRVEENQYLYINGASSHDCSFLILYGLI